MCESVRLWSRGFLCLWLKDRSSQNPSCENQENWSGIWAACPNRLPETSLLVGEANKCFPVAFCCAENVRAAVSEGGAQLKSVLTHVVCRWRQIVLESIKAFEALKTSMNTYSNSLNCFIQKRLSPSTLSSGLAYKGSVSLHLSAKYLPAFYLWKLCQNEEMMNPGKSPGAY